MACWDSRPGGPLRLPRLLAIAPGEHGRGRFARRPPSYFRLPQSQQNIEDVVAPFRLPCPQGIGASLTKYVANGALPHPTRQSISAAKESEIRGAGEKQ